jgi:benzoylformate decarboxylase
VIVLNNGGYGALRSFSQALQICEVPSFELPGLDFVTLAAGMGCPGRRIDRPEDIADALTDALARKGPFLLDVIVDPAVPVLYSSRLP